MPGSPMAKADRFLYLETRGRKTGLPRQIEIWWVAHAGRYYLIAETRERAQWVKNLRADPAVAFSVGTRKDREAALPRTRGQARTLDETLDRALAAEVRGLMDAKYGWSDGLIVELAPLA